MCTGIRFFAKLLCDNRSIRLIRVKMSHLIYTDQQVDYKVEGKIENMFKNMKSSIILKKNEEDNHKNQVSNVVNDNPSILKIDKDSEIEIPSNNNNISNNTENVKNKPTIIIKRGKSVKFQDYSNNFLVAILII